MTLTPAQERMLRTVCRHGRGVYNGHATRTVRRLRSLGLVTVEHELVPRSKGYGLDATDQWTVRPNYVKDTCSWCSGEVTAENRVTLIGRNTGRLYQFNHPSCLDAFERDSNWDNS